MLTPQRTFTLLSLVLVTLTMLVTGFILVSFFRTAIVERELAVISQTTQAIAARDLRAGDLADTLSPGASAHLERIFFGLRSLSDVVRIKVFNRNNVLIWSDVPTLIGTASRRSLQVEKAFAGAGSVIFYNAAEAATHISAGQREPVVEYYLPLYLPGGEAPAAVVALYRSATELNQTLRQGVLLVWAIVAGGGLLLYLTLFGLFRTVERLRQEAESSLLRFSGEHQRIVQMEKLSTMGTMLGEIAHQINNPLVGVINLAQLAERHADDPQRVREYLGEIRQSGEHCSGFIKRMLDFTRLSRYERKTVDLRELARETIALLDRGAEHTAPIETTMPDQPVWLELDPNLIRHAIFNLLLNATQFSPPGQPVTLALKPVTGGNPPRDGWAIIVSDRGPGIAPENADRLFEPFHTTRPGGVGLGLSVCAQIAMLHGGTIDGRNGPQGGAQFTLWLPEPKTQG